jgi:hypothetical protein
MKIAQLVIGIICIAVSIWGFVSGELGENFVIPVAVLIIGIILIAISQRGKGNIRKWWRGQK